MYLLYGIGFITFLATFIYYFKNRNNQILSDKEYKKSLENNRAYYIDPIEFFCVRLNGRSFNRLLKAFDEKDYEVINNCLIKTTTDLVKEFNASTGYITNDEIILVFKNKLDENSEHIFGGFVTKIYSAVSSYASMRFYYHLNNDLINKNTKYQNINPEFSFSAIITTASPEEISDIVYSKSVETFNKFVSKLLKDKVNHYELIGMPTYKRIALLRDNFQIEVDDYDNHLKFGSFIKTKYEENKKTYETRSFMLLQDKYILNNFKFELFNDTWLL